MDEEDKKSRIYIEFEDLGSAHFNLKVENVSVMQMLTLAGYFQFEAEYQLEKNKVQMEQYGHIAVPQPRIEIAPK